MRISNQHNDNKMERLNGEDRDREKTMCGLKDADTPIFEDYQMFHNYMRPHIALGDENLTKVTEPFYTSLILNQRNREPLVC